MRTMVLFNLGLCALFTLAAATVACAEEPPKMQEAPISREFLEWNARCQAGVDSSDTEPTAGYIPSPIDRSHLATNPPRLDLLRGADSADPSPGAQNKH